MMSSQTLPAPVVSCIVPTHNSTRYLGEALASIRVQTWPAIEIIVADDASSDGVEQIAARYQARFVRHERSGPSATRNLGLRNSDAAFVAFLDADDLWHPGKIAKQMAILEVDPALMICTTDIATFSRSDETGAPVVTTSDRTVPGLLTTTLLARREAFDRVGPLNPDLWFSDSADWFLRAADAGMSLVELPETLTYHRVHGQNLSLRRNQDASHEFLRLIKTSLDRRRAKACTPIRRTVAIGPAVARPSWQWIGPDTARELSRDHDVSIFESFDSMPDAEILILVKSIPPIAFVAEALRSKRSLIFVPVDVYETEEQIRLSGGFLRSCSAVMAHSEALLPHLRPFCRRLIAVDHHAKFVLPQPFVGNVDSYVLWSGGMQHVPHLLAWIRDNPIDVEVKILTDLENEQAHDAARKLAREIGVDFDVAHRGTSSTINGLAAHPWSADAQIHMMASCRAAIDIKGAGFGQLTKPPTKAQQSIASGIPFACNRPGSAFDSFRRRGFEIADPRDTDRWFSPKYREETCAFARQLREELSIASVARVYRDVIDAI